jgi:hypothetical protein
MRSEAEIRKVAEQMRSMTSVRPTTSDEIRCWTLTRMLLDAFDWVLGAETRSFNDRSLELLALEAKET